MKITSPAFDSAAPIPARHTCEGGDIAPALQWTGVPDGTRSLALVVEDPDAPDPAAPKRVFIHWVLYNIPPVAGGLPEGGDAPEGALAGRNDWDQAGYGGPCPPVGRHRYFFKLFALDTVLPDLGLPHKAPLEAAMRGHILGEAVLMGTYQKTKA